jgi:hypothetical protein
VEDSQGVEIRNFQGPTAHPGINALQPDCCEDVRAGRKEH